MGAELKDEKWTEYLPLVRDILEEFMDGIALLSGPRVDMAAQKIAAFMDRREQEKYLDHSAK